MSNFFFTLQGNLAADPTVGVTESGREYANVTVIRTDRYQVNGQWRDGRTLAIRFTFWGKAAETVDNMRLGKGDRVWVEVGSDLHQEVYGDRPQLLATGRNIALLAKRRSAVTPAPDAHHNVVPETGGYSTGAEAQAA